jgi:hypothetical protein
MWPPCNAETSWKAYLHSPVQNFTGLLPNNINLSFYDTYRHGPMCRKKKLTSKYHSTNTLRKSSFSDVGVTLFNILQRKLKAAKTLVSFKAQVIKSPSWYSTNPGICVTKHKQYQWLATKGADLFIVELIWRIWRGAAHGRGGATQIDTAYSVMEREEITQRWVS